MSKVTFYGLPSWVGAIHGPTVCDWWNCDPSQVGWNRTQLCSVDLAKTPSAAIAGRITVSEIEVDDHVSNGGRSTVGPLFPSGTMIGACWVTDAYLARLGAAAPSTAVTGGDGHPYEYQTVQYFEGEQQNRRFIGFHANVLQEHNHLSLVEVWNPGTGAGAAKPAGTWWLDLGANADPATPPLVVNQPGALFLASTAAQQLAPMEIKLPPHKGSVALLA